MQQVGVQAVFDVEAFERGLDKYINGLVRANTASTTTATEINDAATRMAASIISNLNNVLPTVNTVVSSLSSLKAQLNSVVAAVETSISTTTEATTDALAAANAAASAAASAEAASDAADAATKKTTRRKAAPKAVVVPDEAEAIAAVGKEIAALTTKLQAEQQRAVNAIAAAANEALKGGDANDDLLKAARRDLSNPLKVVENAVGKTVDSINEIAARSNLGDRFKNELAQVQAEGQKIITEISGYVTQFDTQFRALYGNNARRALSAQADAKAPPVPIAQDQKLKSDLQDVTDEIINQLKNLETARDRLAVVLGSTATKVFSSSLDLIGLQDVRQKIAQIAQEIVDEFTTLVAKVNASGQQIDFKQKLETELLALRDLSKTLGGEIAANLASIDKRIVAKAKGATTAATGTTGGTGAANTPNPNAADALVQITAEIDKYTNRLVAARDKAVALLVAASQKATTNALDPNELAVLRTDIKRITSGITSDVEALSVELRGIAKGADVGQDLNRQLAVLRANVRVTKDDITASLRAFNAQFQTGSKTTAASEATAQAAAQSKAALLQTVGGEIAAFITRLNDARDKAVQQLAAATQKATTQALDATELAQLRQQVATIRVGITNDLNTTIANLEQLGKGVDIGSELKVQLTDLRNTVRTVKGEIGGDLALFNAQFSKVTKTTASPTNQAQQGLVGSFADLQKELQSYFTRLQTERDKTVALLNQASAKALTETLQPSELAAIKAQVNTTTTGITNDLRVAVAELNKLAGQLNIPIGDELIAMRNTTASTLTDIRNSVQAFNAQFQSKGKTTSDAALTDLEKRSADSLQKVVTEAGNFVTRLQAARDKAIQALNTATVTAATQALSPVELQDLKNSVNTITTEIATDLSNTVNTINNLGKNANIGTQLTNQLTVLRNAVKATSTEIQNNLNSFDAQFRSGGKSLGSTPQFAQAQDLGTAYLENLKRERDRIFSELNSLSARAAQGLVSSRELTNYKRGIQRDLSDLMTVLQNTINQMSQLGKQGGFGNTLNATFNQLRGELRKTRQEISSEYQAIVRDTYNFKGGMQSTLGALFTQGFVLGLGIEAFNALSRAIQNLRAVATEGVQITQFFERLNISLETLTARDLARDGGYDKFSDALAAAKPLAAGLVLELEKLAVFSPFTTEGIATAFQTANTYGFTADQALRLTRALVDFSSGAGLTQEQLGRISLGLSQIVTNSKLAGQEVRQLAEAGVPIYDILGKAFNKTTAELRQLQADGLLEGRAVAEAVLSYFETTFQGAALRVSKTITGLLSSLKDIRELGLRDIFTGLLTPLVPLLQTLVDFTTTNEFRAGLKIIGELLGKVVAGAVSRLMGLIGGLIAAWKALSPQTKEIILIFAGVTVGIAALGAAIGALAFLVGALINPVTVVASAIAGLYVAWYTGFNNITGVTRSAISTIGFYFDGLARDAVRWGENIVGSLADGIVGAVGYVIDALGVMGTAITTLLKPGSPPRLLPDLDKWGAQAADVYLEGWTLADYGILDKMGGALQTFLQNLADRNQIDPVSVPGLVMGGTSALADALAQFRDVGMISKKVFDQIRESGKGLGSILVDYVGYYIKAAQATDAVRYAQDALNSVTKKYDSILKPLQARLNQITNTQKTAEEAKRIKQLENVINSRYASEARKKKAALELEQILIEQQIRGVEAEKTGATEIAQSQLDAAQKAQEAAQNELALFEARLSQQTNYNSLLADEVKLREQAAKEAERLAKEAEKAAKEAQQAQLRRITILQEELKDLLRIYELNYTLQKGGLTLAQESAAQIELEEIATRRFQRALEAIDVGVDLGFLSNIQFTLDDLPSKLTKADKGLGDLEGTLAGIADLDLAGSLKEFEDSLFRVRKRFTDLGTEVERVMGKINDSLPGFLKFINEPIQGPKTEAQSGFLTDFGEQLEGIQDPLAQTTPLINTLTSSLTGLGVYLATTKIGGLIGALFPNFAKFSGWLNVIGLVLAGLTVAWQNNWFGIRDVAVEAMDKIGIKLDELGIDLSKLSFDNIKDAYKRLNEAVGEKLGNNFDLTGLLRIISAITTSQIIGTVIKRLVPYLKIFFGTLLVFGPKILGLFTKGGLIAAFTGLRTLFTGGLGIKALLPLLGGVALKFNLLGVAGNLLMLAFEKNWFNIRDTTYNILSTIAGFLDTVLFTGGAVQRGLDNIWKYVGTSYTEFFKVFSGEISFGDFSKKLLTPFEGVIQGVRDFIDGVKYYLTFDNFGDFVGKIFIELPGALITAFVSEFQNFVEFLPGFLEYSAGAWGRNIGAYFEFIIGDFLGGIVKLLDLGFTGILALFDESKKGEFWKKAKEFFGDILDRIGELVGPEFGEEISESWDIAWNDSIKPALAKLTKSIKDLFTKKWDEEIKPAFKQAGRDAIEGLFVGIQEFIDAGSPPWVSRAVKSILDSFRRSLGIASPSTLFRDEVGLDTGRGLIVGIVQAITEGTVEVITAIGEMIAALFNPEALLAYGTQAYNLGVLIKDEIVRGLTDSAGVVTEQLSNWFKSITGSFGWLFGEGDPPVVPEVKAGSVTTPGVSVPDINPQLNTVQRTLNTLDNMFSSTGSIGNRVGDAGTVVNAGNVNYTTNFNLAVNARESVGNVVQDFGRMKVFATG